MLTEFYHRPDADFVRGQGVWLWDSHGDRYFDAVSGVGSNILGHCEPSLVTAAQHQLTDLWQVSNQLRETQRDTLASRLCALTGMDQVFFHATGSEAMDLALKISQWNRPGSVAVLDHAFHGTTLSATMVTQWPGTYENLSINAIPTVRIHRDTDLDQVAFSSISAILIEPVLGMGGATALDPAWLADIYQRAKQANCVIIADECQCGFYRCGGISVMQDLGLTPDILILSKGLANGMPLSACLFQNKFSLGRHGTTYGGTALSCGVANKVLDLLQDTDLTKARHTVRDLLSPLESLPQVSCMRFHGHMVAIELNGITANDAWHACLQHRVLVVRNLGNSIRLMLPVNVTAQELEYLYQQLKESLS